MLVKMLKKDMNFVKMKATSFLYQYKFVRLYQHKKVLKKYLANGMYVVGRNKYENNQKFKVLFSIEPVNTTNFRLPFFVIHSISKLKLADNTRVDVYWGKHTGKMLFYLKDIVLSFYPSNCGVLSIVDSLFKEINYPICDFLMVDKRKNYYINPRINGVRISEADNDTQIKFLKRILRLNAISKKHKYDDYNTRIKYRLSNHGFELFEGGYAQHGDFHGANILCNNTTVSIIDLDNIDIFPPFYDFFTYLGFQKELIPLFYAGIFDEEFYQVLLSLNAEVDKRNKDYYLGAFLAVFNHNWMIRNYLEFLPKDYTRTKKVMLTFFSDNNIEYLEKM